MKLLRRLLAAAVPAAACLHSGKRADDCAGCQADRSLAPTWPEDHVPFADATGGAAATGMPADRWTADDWRTAA